MRTSARQQASIATRAREREPARARRQVLRCFQDLVDAGAASWQSNADGQRQLRLQHGAVYLLLETAIKRLR